MLTQNNSLTLDQSLHQSLHQSLVLRRNIRVNSFKLPSDFFTPRQLSRYSPKRSTLKRSLAKETTRQTSTPSFERDQQLMSSSGRMSFLVERKIETARANMNKDDTLIHEVISTARNIRRVLRKKSLQMERNSVQLRQSQIHLPQIRNQRVVNGMW